MNQEKIWDKISEDWSKFRNRTPDEVNYFLKKQKGKILDLGCGSGRNFIKNKKIIYYGVDFSKKMLDLAKIKINKLKIKAKLFKSSTEKLPFKNEFFDSAIFISTLHCVKGKKNRNKTIKELYRVLKKNSNLMISVWDKEANKKLFKKIGKEGYTYWNINHKKLKRYTYLYDKEELFNDLRQRGFIILKTDKKCLNGKHSRKNIVIYCKK